MSRLSTSTAMCTTSTTGTITASLGTGRNRISTGTVTSGSCTGIRTTPTSTTSTTRGSLASNLFQATELGARLDAALGEPALVHLECIASRPGRAVRLLGLGLHVGDVEDRAGVVEEGDRQRHIGVLHPHALDGRLVEDEQHPGVRAERLAVHEALHAGVEVGGDFRADEMHAGVQLHARQLGVRG